MSWESRPRLRLSANTISRDLLQRLLDSPQPRVSRPGPRTPLFLPFGAARLINSSYDWSTPRQPLPLGACLIPFKGQQLPPARHYFIQCLDSFNKPSAICHPPNPSIQSIAGIRPPLVHIIRPTGNRFLNFNYLLTSTAVANVCSPDLPEPLVCLSILPTPHHTVRH
jgi:hypothetical protein